APEMVNVAPTEKIARGKIGSSRTDLHSFLFEWAAISPEEGPINSPHAIITNIAGPPTVQFGHVGRTFANHPSIGEAVGNLGNLAPQLSCKNPVPVPVRVMVRGAVLAEDSHIAGQGVFNGVSQLRRTVVFHCPTRLFPLIGRTNVSGNNGCPSV